MNKNDSNNTSGTNWEALTAMSDDTIDYSDIPPLTDEFFERATLKIPAAQAQNLVHLDRAEDSHFNKYHKESECKFLHSLS